MPSGSGTPPVGGPSAWAEFFQRDPAARAVMRFAQRANLTYREAELRLDFVDADAESGWALFEALSAANRCPNCGVNHDDMDDADGRIADEPMWKLVLHECAICYNRHKLMADIKEEDRPGLYYAVEPREEGEPVLPVDD